MGHLSIQCTWNLVQGNLMVSTLKTSWKKGVQRQIRNCHGQRKRKLRINLVFQNSTGPHWIAIWMEWWADNVEDKQTFTMFNKKKSWSYKFLNKRTTLTKQKGIKKKRYLQVKRPNKQQLGLCEIPCYIKINQVICKPQRLKLSTLDPSRTKVHNIQCELDRLQASHEIGISMTLLSIGKGEKRKSEIKKYSHPSPFSPLNDGMEEPQQPYTIYII